MTHITAISALEAFRFQYKLEPSHAAYAPGRVNIIGEHTDYNDGFVLPAAIKFGTSVAIGARRDTKCFVYSTNYPGEVDEFDLNNITINRRERAWTNYIRGVINTLIQEGHALKGMNIAVSGDIPQGAGLSSSASLEVATAFAINDLHKLDLDRVKMAQVGQFAENHFVGCNCGIMDQLASACGKKQSALFIDCRSLEHLPIYIPDSLELIIIDPSVPRSLVGSEYNTRRESCEEAAQILGVKALRDACMALLESKKNVMSDTTYRRARHIIQENNRVVAIRQAMQRSDEAEIHKLMVESHKSMQHDFEITTKELDFVADTINALCDGLGGARMTGGGFGGCAIALLPRARSKLILDEFNLRYDQAFDATPTYYRSEFSSGAHAVAIKKQINNNSNPA